MTIDQRTIKLRRGRAWPALDPWVFAVAVVTYAVAVPLGLARVDAAPQVAAAVALDAGSQGAPLTLFLTRILGYLPVGDLPFRANLIACMACALATALVARLAVELVGLFRPPPSARQDLALFLYEPVAAAGAAFAAALSLAAFEAGVTAGTTSLTLALLLAALLAELALLRDTGNTAAGLTLAGLAGLSAGVGPMAGPVLWPVLTGLAFWALRKGARWPLFAPLCFVATLGGFALASSAASSVALSIRDVFISPFVIVPQGRAALWMTALEIGDQVGAVGVLLAIIGAFVLFSRAAVTASWLALNLITCLLFANTAHMASLGNTVAGGAMSVRAALPMAIAVTCLLGCVGIVHVSARLGRARLAGALTLAVILVFSPAMDGGRARWLARPLPMRLLDRALDRAESRGVVEPGTAEMAGLFQLGRALGLRPDLELASGPRQQ
jgi:hypothetical protein